jgi:hypothetical protein
MSQDVRRWSAHDNPKSQRYRNRNVRPSDAPTQRVFVLSR